MKKLKFSTELAYIIGIAAIALGTALMEKADFGMSMVVAPAYLLYLKLSQVWSFLTFGMMEYIFQAVLLIVMSIALRKFRPYYLFSFVTAVIYGFALDGAMAAVSFLTSPLLPVRIALFVLGVLLCAFGVAFLFHTYIAPEVYELLVKEVAAKYNKNISRVKTVYDCISCLCAIILSFSFYGLFRFEGVKLGTVVCALVNGWIIGFFGGIFEKHLEFKDTLPLRRFFEKA